MGKIKLAMGSALGAVALTLGGVGIASAQPASVEATPVLQDLREPAFCVLGTHDGPGSGCRGGSIVKPGLGCVGGGTGLGIAGFGVGGPVGAGIGAVGGCAGGIAQAL